MLRNFNVPVLAIDANVSVKECYDAIGKFDLAEGYFDATMNNCFPKTSDNGALATGTGVYNNGSSNGQTLTITQPWVVRDTVFTMWLKEKIGKTTNLCSIMCELDEGAVCSDTSRASLTLSELWASNST